MATRHSWAVGIDETEGVITVEDARLSMGALWTPTGQITSRTGLVPAAAEPGRVTASSPTPNGEVHVAPFRAVLQSERGGGTYTLCLDEPHTIDVLDAAPADPANGRIDLIVWQQSDTFFTDPDSLLRIRHVVGTPAGSPVDPAVDGSDDYVLRARVTVPAGATSLDDGDIANVPLPWTVATGGLLPVRSQAERTAITAPYDGLGCWRQDRDWVEVYDGTAWRVQGVAVVANAADLSAITHPYNGLLAFNTALGICYKRLGGAWHLLHPIPYDEPTQTGHGSLTAASTATVATVNVDDPGVPYRVEVWGQIESTTPAAGFPFSIQATHGSAVWDTNRIGRTGLAIGPVTGIDAIGRLPDVQRSSQLTGAQVIRLLCLAGANNIAVSNGTNYAFSVRVVPAVPVEAP